MIVTKTQTTEMMIVCMFDCISGISVFIFDVESSLLLELFKHDSRVVELQNLQ